MRDSSLSVTSFSASSYVAVSSSATTWVRGIMISFTRTSVKASTLESSSSRTLSMEPCRAPSSIRYSSSREVTDSTGTGALPIARLSARGNCTKTQASG